MRLTTWMQIAWWGGAGLLLLLLFWVLGSTVTPFVLGAAIAYILNPLTGRVMGLGLSRPLAVGAITLLAVLIIAAGLVLLVPALIREAGQLVQALPGYAEAAHGWISDRFPGLLPGPSLLPAGILPGERNAEIAQQVTEVAGKALPTLLQSVTSLLGTVLLLLVAPVVAFYLLLDWNRMIDRIDTLLPRDHADTIRELARQMDASLAGFLRGQGLVTLILGAFYAASLVAVGLPYGLVVGIMAAVLSIIPYVGAFIGGLTAIGIALVHFWNDPLWIGVVVAIFAFGQAVEGNVLQPRIVGGSVGLHPVWLMLALAVFGALFGFAGLVVAVPLAAVVGVLARFAVARYQRSGLYTGRVVPSDPPAPLLVEMVPRGTSARRRVSASIARNDAMAQVRAEAAQHREDDEDADGGPAPQADDGAGGDGR